MKLKNLELEDVEKFFNYWFEHSDNVCDCCKNKHYLEDCSGEDCEFYHALTDEEIKNKGYMLYEYHYGDIDDKWSCLNTDDFEFCEKIKKTPCFNCINNNEIENFSWNGQVK